MRRIARALPPSLRARAKIHRPAFAKKNPAHSVASRCYQTLNQATFLVIVLGLLFPQLASAEISSVDLSVSPASVARGESATFTLSVVGETRGGEFLVDIGGDAVLGSDWEVTGINGDLDIGAPTAGGEILVTFGAGQSQRGTVTVAAIGDGPAKELTYTVAECVDFSADLPCPTGSSATLTIDASEDPPIPDEPVAPGPDDDTAGSSVGNLGELPGLTGNQRIIGTAVTDVCQALAGQSSLNSAEEDLFEQCSALLSTTDVGAAIQGVSALTPEQAVAPRKLTNRLSSAQLDNVATRLAALRGGARGVSLRGFTMNIDGQRVDADTLSAMLDGATDMRGGAASADEGYQFERFGVFINGNVDWGSKDRTANEEGFDFDTLGITAGMDYRFLEGLVAGVALGYGSSDVTIDADGGDLDATAWTLTLYGTYYPTEQFYFEGSASYGWGSYDQTRNIAYSLLGSAREAKADFDGNQYALMLGAGYDITSGPFLFDVYGRLNYVSADVDGYRERGATGLDLNIRDQSSTSFRSVLGGQVTRAVSVPWAVLLPQAWIEWSHEFEEGDDTVTGTFSNDPSQIVFALGTDRFDTDYFRAGLGVGAQFGKGRTAFISYDAALGLRDYVEQSVNLGVRLDF